MTTIPVCASQADKAHVCSAAATQVAPGPSAIADSSDVALEHTAGQQQDQQQQQALVTPVAVAPVDVSVVCVCGGGVRPHASCLTTQCGSQHNNMYAHAWLCSKLDHGEQVVVVTCSSDDSQHGL
jgi:hypothetical protein